MFTLSQSIVPHEDDRFHSEADPNVLKVLLDEAEQTEHTARPQPAVDPLPRRLYALD